jgi:type II secretory pathway component PulC
MKTCALLGFLVSVVVGACGGGQRPEFPDPSSEDDPQAGRVEVVRERHAAHGQSASGLTRERLNAVLDAGPATFLRGVKVKASLVEDKFAGWEIVAFNDPELAGNGLLPGDVVVSANGKSLEHPEELGYVFEQLRNAPELTVTYRRAGSDRVLHVPIVEK